MLTLICPFYASIHFVTHLNQFKLPCGLAYSQASRRISENPSFGLGTGVMTRRDVWRNEWRSEIGATIKTNTARSSPVLVLVYPRRPDSSGAEVANSFCNQTQEMTSDKTGEYPSNKADRTLNSINSYVAVHLHPKAFRWPQ